MQGFFEMSFYLWYSYHSFKRLAGWLCIQQHIDL
jgi:hypothetical protein